MEGEGSWTVFRSTIGSRLGLLLFVSLAGLVFFGVLTAREEQHAAEAARQLTQEGELVELLSSASVHLGVQTDSIAGLQEASSLGVDLSVIGALAGIDVVDDYNSARDLDDVLDEIELVPRERWAAPEAIEQLLTTRPEFNDVRGSPDAERLVVESINDRMAAALDTALLAQTMELNAVLGRVELDPALASMAEARDQTLVVLAAAITERRAMSSYLLPLNDQSDDENYRSLIAATARYDDSMTELRRLLLPAHLDLLDETMAAQSSDAYFDLKNEAINDVAAPGSSFNDPLSLLPRGLVLFVDAFEHIRALLAFERALSTDFTNGILEVEADAERRLGWAVAIGVGLSVLVISLSIVTVRSITGPVRDLLIRARRITEGDLSTVGPRTGPGDIGLVHHALDEMSANLRTLSEQTEALSDGRLDDEVLNHNVAGPLGTSVHGSVARLRSMTARLEYEATHDSLTKLPNRSAVISFLERCLTGNEAKREPLTAIMLDLDGFKQVNDDMGHVVGDEVLINVAKRLQRSAKGEFVARLGGDEFMVVVVGDDCDNRAGIIAKACVASISGPTTLSIGTAHISSSAGIASAKGGAWHSPTEMLRRVDLAMYEAKSGDEEIVWFDQELHDSMLETTRLQGEIRRALDHDEFTLALQPILAVADGHIAGYEGLIRWQSPTRGNVAPGLFIPTAEQSNLIDQVDDWVLDHGGDILADWRDDPSHQALTLSINVSARHLSNPKLVGMVASVIDANNLDSRRLLLEVTESQLIPSLARAENTLRGLRALGVRLAIDDFGTGYASVAHLRRVKFDRLKIDRSFLAHLDDETDRALATLLVSLGRDLDMEVVAEGIETPTQLEWAIASGCTHVQGYLIGRPSPSVLTESPSLDTMLGSLTGR